MNSEGATCVIHVDDNRADSVMVRRLLVQIEPDTEIHSLTNARALFELLATPGQAERVDLILLDLNMPGVSGHEVISRLKSDPELARLPVVALSCSSATRDQDLAYEQGVNAYLIKPSDLDSYRRKLAAALSIWGNLERPPASDHASDQTLATPTAELCESDIGLRALIVDDAQGDAQLVRRYLERLEGWRIECDTVATPHEAHTQLEAHHYDLLLLDYRLGSETGLTVLEQCQHSLSNTGTILLTGVGDEDIAAEAIRVGVDDYLTKSALETSALEASIGRALERAQRRSGLQIDRLTGLYNRDAMQERLAEELNRCHRYGGHFSLMLIDLDRFKPINDTYGHPVGDALLKQVGNVIRQTQREVDFPARYGGDEFCIIAPEVTAEQARQLAQRLHDQLTGTVFYCGEHKHPLQIGCSIGILECDHESSSNTTTVLQQVDSAMYRAKKSGGHAIEVIQP